MLTQLNSPEIFLSQRLLMAMECSPVNALASVEIDRPLSGPTYFSLLSIEALRDSRWREKIFSFGSGSRVR
jgi:hypothetical protein